MFMQSNEPFSKVDQGMSPMSAGLLGAIGVGGAAAAYQGTGYASYTGIDKKYDGGIEQATNKMGNIRDGEVKRLNGEIRGNAKDIRGNTQNINKHNETLNGHQARYDNITNRFQNNESIGRGEVKGINQNVNNTHKKLVNKVSNLEQQSQLKYDSIGNLRQQRKEVQIGEGAILDNHKKYQKQKSKLESFGDENRLKEKEAHRWHGKNFKSSAIKSGGFAAGGFVVGGGVQMALNKFSNA